MESIQFAKAVSITFPHALDGIALAEEVARQDGESFPQFHQKVTAPLLPLCIAQMLIYGHYQFHILRCISCAELQ